MSYLFAGRVVLTALQATTVRTALSLDENADYQVRVYQTHGSTVRFSSGVDTTPSLSLGLPANGICRPGDETGSNLIDGIPLRIPWGVDIDLRNTFDGLAAVTLVVEEL